MERPPRRMAGGGVSALPEAEAETKLECFDFAFNSEKFSDRLLRIEVVAGDDVAEGSLTDCARHRKDNGDKRQRIDSSPTMLFSNGMKESDQTHPTIRIADSESALLYLDHGCSSLLAAEAHSVIGAAKQFLAEKFRDFDKFCDEAMDISLAGVEAIFSSTDIHVESEDDIYNFLLRWARARYLESNERRKILSSRLLPLVRFNHMAGSALQEILTSTDTDIDHELVTKRVTEVLLQKGYAAQLEGALAADATTAERAYTMKPMKVVAFDQPCRQVIVYWDLTLQECSRLFPSGEILSHPFHLAGHWFYIVTICEMVEQNKLHRFGLILGILGDLKDSTCITVDYEFAARTGLSGKFVSHFDSKHTFPDDLASECSWTPCCWSNADDGHFIDDVLHLRVDITMVEQPILQT